MISKLTQYNGPINGTDCIIYPTKEDCVDKINEIIDFINNFIDPIVENIKKETAREILNQIKEVSFSKAFKDFRINQGSNGQRDYIINSIIERYGIEE